MARRVWWVALAGAITIALASCGAPQKVPAPRPVTVLPSEVAPENYMASAASSSLFIIRASELVAAREGNSRLGLLARQFISEQEGVGSQLSFAGRRLNQLPSAALLPAHQAMLDAMTSSSDPSATYVRTMKRVVAQGLALHRAYDAHGSSATLRPVAAMAAAVFHRELDDINRF